MERTVTGLPWDGWSMVCRGSMRWFRKAWMPIAQTACQNTAMLQSRFRTSELTRQTFIFPSAHIECACQTRALACVSVWEEGGVTSSVDNASTICSSHPCQLRS